MNPPKVQRPGGIRGEAAEQTEAHDTPKQYSPSALHFRTPWLPTVCRSLAIKAQPCDLSRSLAVAALCGEIREALR